MKKKMGVVLLGLLILSALSNGQSMSGIYLNADSYRVQKLSYETKCVHVNEAFLDIPYISFKYDGKKYKINKSDVYGFKDCHNNSYRFYNNELYKIVEARNIYIYIQTENLTQSKGFKVITNYYFSISPDGSIIRLNVYNLRTAYSDNKQFRDMLDKYIPQANITDYDAAHGMYKINYWYLQSKNMDNTDK